MTNQSITYTKYIETYPQIEYQDSFPFLYNNMMSFPPSKHITTNKGVPMKTTNTFETKLNIDKKHIGFVIGKNGTTLKSVSSKHYVFAQIINGESPYLLIKGHNPINVEAATIEFKHISNGPTKKTQRHTNHYSPRSQHKQSLMDVATFTIKS